MVRVQLKRLALALLIGLALGVSSNLAAQHVRVNGGGNFGGTTTFTTGPVLFPDGTETAPSIAFAAMPQLGFYRYGSTFMGVTVGTALPYYAFANGDFVIAADGAIGWSGTAGDARQARDVTFSRPAASTLSLSSNLLLPGIQGGAAGDTDACLDATTNELTDAGASTCIVSSARFKNITGPLDTGLREVLRLNPVAFSYKTDPTHRQKIGLTAENMHDVEPRLVFYEKDGVTPRAIDYEELTALLVKAIHELNGRIEQLERSAK
jgi:hypothetical protein